MIPFRGGSFGGYQSQAGVFALSLHDPRSYQYYSLGFRSALFQSKTGIRLYVMPFRGGGFRTIATAGVFALHLENARSYGDPAIGFRSALFQSKQGLGYK